MQHRKSLALIAAMSASMLTVLAACATGPTTTPSAQVPVTETAVTPSSPNAAPHNMADTTFAQMMIVHHQGAIEMANLAQQKAQSAQIRNLAKRIGAAQGLEIEQMQSWLQAWGEPMPDQAGMEGMDHGGMDMGGLDQKAAMDKLTKSSGQEFDRQFLTLMIAHHEGALSMAQQQVSNGQNADTVQLAKAIVAAQQTEISLMRTMLETAEK